MISLKHRSASGSLESMWELDPVRCTIMVVIRGVGFDIPVCRDVDGRRVSGAFVLTRLSEAVWRISPCVFVKRGETWTTVARPYDDSTIAEFLGLTHAPDNVSRELEAL